MNIEEIQIENEKLKKELEKFKSYNKNYYQDITKYQMYYCDVCNCDIKYGSKCNHLKSKNHLKNLKNKNL